MKEFDGKKLREIRTRSDWTQPILARIAMCDAKTISNWETGRNMPSPIRLRKLSDGLLAHGVPESEVELLTAISGLPSAGRVVPRAPMNSKKREADSSADRQGTTLAHREEFEMNMPADCRLARDILKLPVGSELRQDITKILAHPQYPQFMSSSGTFSVNPVWKSISANKRQKLIVDHALNTACAPAVLHSDVLLIIANNDGGTRSVYTYFNKWWQTYFIPCRRIFNSESITERCSNNVEFIRRFAAVPAEKIAVEPLQGHYLVSLKPDAFSKNLCLYVFEFCHVAIKKPPRDPTVVFPPLPTYPGAWKTVGQLKDDLDGDKVNGDVIDHLRLDIAFSLVGVPLSLPPDFICPYISERISNQRSRKSYRRRVVAKSLS